MVKSVYGLGHCVDNRLHSSIAVSGPCPEGSSKFENGKCYGWADEGNATFKTNFFGAKRLCLEKAGFLPEPKNKQDSEALAL